MSFLLRGIMANKSHSIDIMDLYKINRGSVEHFDKILGTFRQIIFAVNGAIVTACLAYLAQKKVPIGTKDYALIFAVSTLLVIINLLIWQLEKHYHRYLSVSAQIAEKIEREMFIDSDKHKFEINMLFALTYQLKEAKSKNIEDIWLPSCLRQFMYRLSRYIRTCDLLYVLPSILALIVNLAVAIRLGFNWMVGSAILSVMSLSIGYIIIRYSHWFERRYKGTLCTTHFDNSSWDGSVPKKESEIKRLADMKKNVKRFIAREGLVLMGVVLVSCLFAFIFSVCPPHPRPIETKSESAYVIMGRNLTVEQERAELLKRKSELEDQLKCNEVIQQKSVVAWWCYFIVWLAYALYVIPIKFIMWAVKILKVK